MHLVYSMLLTFLLVGWSGLYAQTEEQQSLDEPEKDTAAYAKNRAKENMNEGVNTETHLERNRPIIIVDEKSIRIETGGKVINRELKVDGRSVKQLVVINNDVLVSDGANADSCVSIGGLGEAECKED